MDSNTAQVLTETRRSRAEAAKHDERERIRSILNSAHAAGRLDLAKHLALATDLSANDSITMLAKAPTQQTGRPPDRLDEILSGSNPDVGADSDGASELPSKGTRERGYAIVNRMFAATQKDAN